MSVGALKTEADLERWLYQRLDGMPVNRTGGLGDKLALIDSQIATIEGEGVPPSGAAGGVLSGSYPNPGFAVDMATQAELDAEIAAREGADSNLVPKSLVDAKGDLLAASADDTPARLAVGTDGQALVADSAAGTGLAWADFPEGGGDIAGPETSTDNAIARWDGTEGDKLQDSGVTISDADLLSASGGITSPVGGSGTEAFGANVSVGSFTNSTIVGNGAKTTGNAGTALGYQADAGGANGAAFGYLAGATGSAAAAIGYNSVATGAFSFALGYFAKVEHNGSIAFGPISKSTAANQFVCGGTTGFGSIGQIFDVYFGGGATSTSEPQTSTLQVSGGSGENKAGWGLALAGGKGTGTGNGGDLELQVALPGEASGEALNSLSTVLSISGEDGALQHEDFPLGFYGVTPTSRQVLPTGSTTDQVIEALQTLGLVSQE